MEYVLTAKEMSDADRYTSETLGIPSIVLMERAALAAANAVRDDFPSPVSGKRPIRVAVVAGKGNNGADALAAGRILLDAGYEVIFYSAIALSAMPRSSSPSNMETQLAILTSYGAILHPLQELLPATDVPPEAASFAPSTAGSLAADSPLQHTDVILDGLFGTGLSRAVDEMTAAIIRVINRQRLHGARIYALDIPSGVCATTGAVMSEAIEADVTVTFAFYKLGHFLYPGTRLCGRVIRADIGITTRALSRPGCFTYLGNSLKELLPGRDPSGNKGTFGKVLVIAGSRGVCGAAYLCTKAALRAGSGMARIYTQEFNREILQKMLPEAMCSTYGDVLSSGDLQTLSKDLSWADVAAIGPGIGKGMEGRKLLTHVLQYAAGLLEENSGRLRGLVIDADALRLIADSRSDNRQDSLTPDLYDLLSRAGRRMPVIVTPHAAECAALLHTDLHALQQNRFLLLPEFAKAHHCVLLGKDARTLVAGWESSSLYLNTSGNDGLATAGSGDVLTGITAALLAQGMDGFEAACAAACLHGRLADLLLQTQSAGSIMASDLIDALTRLDTDRQG